MPAAGFDIVGIPGMALGKPIATGGWGLLGIPGMTLGAVAFTPPIPPVIIAAGTPSSSGGGAGNRRRSSDRTRPRPRLSDDEAIAAMIAMIMADE